MLDIKFIRENTEKVKEAIRNKKVDLNLDALLDLDKRRVEMMQEIEGLQSLKNDINELIQKAKTDEERKEIIERGKEIKLKLEKIEPELKKTKEEFEELMLKVPNVPSDDTPVGIDESENKILRTVGDVPSFDFKAKEHWVLGEELGVIDTEKATQVSGARFAYLKGDLALLEFALIQFSMAVLTDEKLLAKIIKEAGLEISANPFVPVVPPIFIRPEVYQRMARLEPKEERYYIPSDDVYLIGSAEHTLGPIHMDETLEEKTLPRRYVGFSVALRREAGSYGKDMKGILRLHQFDKVEMESFTTPGNGLAEQNFIVAIQEYLMQELKIPYRVMQICTGDMGGPDARQIDVECWMPGQGRYRETHTSDYNTDYQSRRLNTKVKRENGKAELVHMNDATALAIGRTIIAIMENYQQADGSVKIPEVLQKYMPGNMEYIKKK